MIAVIGTYRIPLENIEQARVAWEKVLTATRAEDGCVLYSFAEDVIDPGLIRVCERWESRDNLTAHIAAPHMVEYAAQREKFGIYDRDIKVYDIGEPSSL